MDSPSAIRVRVPASSANLGPGFDALALALGLYLQCELRRSPEGLRIEAQGTDASEIPRDQSNLVWKAFLQEAGERAAPESWVLAIRNEIPIGKGLGSSAAAILAGLALANEWLGIGRSRQEIVQAATRMEGHPDNVAAAALGGLVVSCQAEDGNVLSAPASLAPELEVVVVVPELRLATEAARAVLPPSYPRQDAIFNLQRVALLLAALRDGRAELFREALRDRWHQPYRAPLVPGFSEILNLRNIPGLLGVALSGAGPSVVAFCCGHATEVGDAIAACFRAKGIQAQPLQLPIDHQGIVTERVSSGELLERVNPR